MMIGFHRNAGPWAIIKGNISSRRGRDIYFSPSVDPGHSDGPIFQGGKVVAVVGDGSQTVGLGVSIRSAQDYLEGFGITAQERTNSSSSVASVLSLPPSATTVKPESHSMTHAREITGKDGASMVLIAAWEFWMGSPDDEGTPNEHPRHWVYLEAYDMDRFEVTVSRYAEFLQSIGRQAPHD